MILADMVKCVDEELTAFKLPQNQDGHINCREDKKKSEARS